MAVNRFADLLDLVPGTVSNAADPKVVGGAWQYQWSCTWGGNNDVHRMDNGALLPNQCIGLQAITGLSPSAAIPTTWTRLILWNDYFPFGALRQRNRHYYTRPVAGEASHLQIWPSTWLRPNPLAWPWPALDPLALPIAQPAPRPRPIPRRLIPGRRPNPFRAPGEQPQRGPASVPHPARGLAVEVGKDSRPQPIIRPRARPKPHTKERKFMLALNPRSGLGLLYNAASEGKDFVECFYEALPKELQKLRGWDHTIPNMLRVVWDNFDKIDWEAAFQNLVENEIEDRLFGMLGKAVGKANRARGAPAGISFGPAL